MHGINKKQRFAINLPAISFAVTIAGTGAALLSANPLLTFASTIVLCALWYRAGKSPYRIIMAGYLSYQWLQASMKLLIADLLGIDLSEPLNIVLCRACQIKLFEVNDQTVLAIVISLSAVLMVLVGARALEPRLNFTPTLSGLSPTRLFAGYLALLAVDRLSGPFIGGGLAQAFIAIGSFKFAMIAMLAYYWMLTRRGLPQLMGTVLIELVFGFSGYFADFKTVFIIAALAVLTIGENYWRRAWSVLVISTAAAIVLGSIWFAVRPAYRTALNGGLHAQIVTIDFGRRLALFEDLVEDVDLRQIVDGFEGMANRISYVDVFSLVLQQVPQAIPYTGGELWKEAIDVAAEPRILFPDKDVLPSDSVRTSHYTGRVYASTAEGTSVSIGYVGDSYIDFGVAGALAIPFALGLLYALIARTVIGAGSTNDITFGMAALIVILRPVMLLEVSNVKLFPGELYLWLIGVIAVKYVWPNVRNLFCAPAFTPAPIVQSYGGIER